MPPNPSQPAPSHLPPQANLPIPLSTNVLKEVDQIDTMLQGLESHMDQASNLAELGAFAHMYAHEVNNLMTQVGGRAQLALMNMDRPEKIIQALELACHASSQIAQLSELFMDASTSWDQHESSVSQIHEFALGFLADQDIEAFGFSITDVQTELGLSFPPLLLQQVLLNLYLNATHAIKESDAVDSGQISTHVEIVDGRKGQPAEECSTWNNTPKLVITVKDNGIGMSAEQLSAAFQANMLPKQDQEATQHSAKDQDRGHGLGLSICQRLLANAQGSLHAQSTPGTGTEMIITLPCRPVAA